MSNILLIEDNEAIIMGLEYLFTNNGYNVRVARSAYQAKEILDNAKETEKYRTLIGAGDVWNIDIVILDVMLPDGDGFSLCRKIKADDIAPVIFLTAKDEEKDVVMGLELGADDYVIKPFRNMELLSRIKNVLRRNRSGNELTFADLKMDVDIRKLYKADNEVKLTKLEFEILKILLQNPKKVFTREEILSHIWDSAGNFVNDNTLTVTMKRLRDKIGDKEGNIMSIGFEKAYALQTDMNLPASEILSTYVYRIGLLNGDYGYSTAVGLFNSVVNVILLVFVNWVVQKLNDGEGL